MTDEPSDIDLLMSKLDDVEFLTNMPKEDLAKLIAYQRSRRVQREQGVKPKKAKAQPAVSIEELLERMQPGPKVVSPPKPGAAYRRY